MKVREIMSADVASCLPSEPVLRATALMQQHDCGCVPVIDGDARVVGMLTDRDICLAAAATGETLGQLRVARVMTQPVVSCHADDTLLQACALMRQHQVRRLPVTDDGGRLLGLLSLSDVAQAAMRHEGDGRLQQALALPATFAEVSRPRCTLKCREHALHMDRDDAPRSQHLAEHQAEHQAELQALMSLPGQRTEDLHVLEQELEAWQARFDRLRARAGQGRQELQRRLHALGERLEPACTVARRRLQLLARSGSREARNLAHLLGAGWDTLLARHRELSRARREEHDTAEAVDEHTSRR